MSTITRRRPVNSANTATTNKLNNAKEATAMKSTTTITLSLDLNNLTKAQKSALTTLGIAYKKPVEKKNDVKKAAPKTTKKTTKKATDPVKKAAPAVKDRIVIRSASTDALVAFNLCMIRKGNKVYDIDATCKAAKAKGTKASTAMFKKYGNGKSFSDWCKASVAFILKSSDVDIINACNGRQDLAESYIKAKG